MTSTHLIIESNVKNLVHENDLDVAKEVFPTLEEKVTAMLITAMNRAKNNGRRTLLSRDL